MASWLRDSAGAAASLLHSDVILSSCTLGGLDFAVGLRCLAFSFAPEQGAGSQVEPSPAAQEAASLALASDLGSDCSG